MDWGKNLCAARWALVDLSLGEPLLATSHRLALFGFPAHARLFIEPTSLQFTEQPFTSELLLGNLEGLVDVVVEDSDFHTTLEMTLLAVLALVLRGFSRPGGRRRSVTQAPNTLKALTKNDDPGLNLTFK